MGLKDWLLGRKKRPEPNPHTGSPVFSVLDVETTGLSPRTDRIVELAIVRLDESGTFVDQWVSRFNPERPMGATHIHGISDRDVSHAPRFYEAAPHIAAALVGTTLVAHNASFDVAFLRNEFRFAGWDLPKSQTYCTLTASTRYLPHLNRRRLGDCCQSAGIPLQDAHSALGDATATAHLLRFYLATDRNNHHAPPWSPVHAAAHPPAPQGWPVHAVRDRLRIPAPSVSPRESTDRRDRRGPWSTHSPAPAVKLSQISEALANGHGRVRIDGDYSPATAAYVELLLTSLDDGILTTTERTDLESLVSAQGVSRPEIREVHHALVEGLARTVVDTGRTPRNERQELVILAAQLDISELDVRQAFTDAEADRMSRLNTTTSALPATWEHGDPLHIGDRIAFTGDTGGRENQESDAARRGLRVTSAVSRRTDLLVWDGRISSTKYRTARELGTRIVSPREFGVLIAHLQRSIGSGDAPAPSEEAVSVGTLAGNFGADETTKAERAGEANPSPPLASPPHRAVDTTRDASERAVDRGTLPSPRFQGFVDPSLVRAWARQNGIPVGTRGRLSADLVHRYRAARADNE